MKNTAIPFALLIALLYPALALASGGGDAAPGVAGQDLLAVYEAVSRALVGDDLASARRESARLAEIARSAGQAEFARHATELSGSESLERAREHFKALSIEAVRLAEGKAGYYVMTCPMVGADWVQSIPRVANPYMGQKMAGCGTIKSSPRS